jgi:PmbA protein
MSSWRRAELRRVAERALQGALSRGATAASAGVRRTRARSFERRDGNLEKIEESVSNALTIKLYHRGRYGVFSTSDVRSEPLDRFLDRAFELVGALLPDPLRALPDPALYRGATRRPLDLADDAPLPDPRELIDVLATLEAGALRAVRGCDVAAVETEATDESTTAVLLHSDGFHASRESTVCGLASSVALCDADGRRPVDRWSTAARRREHLDDAATGGRLTGERALTRLGASPIETGRCAVVVEARAAQRLVLALLDALKGPNLAQRRSFLVDRLGTRVGSERLTLHDDPWVAGGLGSRRCDGEGLAARPRVLIEGGVLRGLLLDTYNARKLGQAPTSGSPSNTVLVPGLHDLAGLLAALGSGLLVTGFLGGNVNATTGDFSFGVIGSTVEGGRVGRAVAGSNLSGNLLELFGSLVEVGADPYLASRLRVPSLRFSEVQVSGR